MIKDITIKNIASYDCNGVRLSKTEEDGSVTNYLKKMNFFFGSNGSGKSTIVKLLRTLNLQKDNMLNLGLLSQNMDFTLNGDNDFSNCNVIWNNPSNDNMLIFDEKFIEESWRINKKVPAVFTGQLKPIPTIKCQIEKIDCYLNLVDNQIFTNFDSPDEDTYVITKKLLSKNKEVRDYLLYNDSFMVNEINKVKNITIKEFLLCELNILNSRLEDINAQLINDYSNKLNSFKETIITTNRQQNDLLLLLIDHNMQIANETFEFVHKSLPISFLYIFLFESPDLSIDAPQKWNAFISSCTKDKLKFLLNKYQENRKEYMTVTKKELTWQLANSKKIVDAINENLINSGYKDFAIKEKTDSNGEQIFHLNREGVSIKKVYETLSEGEKHYFAFLYFHQLCLHKTDVLNPDNNKNKIIVIDDPITSMDSNTMYYVSAIIRNMIVDTKDKQDQLFVITHNNYFYNEFSYGFVDDANYDIATFKVYRDLDTNKTKIDPKYVHLDDYSALWKLLRSIYQKINNENINTNQYNIMLANTFRRILESYVRFARIDTSPWGAINKKDIIKHGFLSWVNADSHSVTSSDSLYYKSISEANPKDLFKIFESIFNQKPINDSGHYNRWMHG